MRLLMDTHTLLWFALASSKMSKKARELVSERANDRFLSIASPWEVGIKVSTGKLTLAKPVDVFFSERIRQNEFMIMPITLAHIALVTTLPFHHRDPFDRMLIAQSLVEGIPIVSADTAFDQYGVTRFW